MGGAREINFQIKGNTMNMKTLVDYVHTEAMVMALVAAKQMQRPHLALPSSTRRASHRRPFSFETETAKKILPTNWFSSTQLSFFNYQR